MQPYIKHVFPGELIGVLELYMDYKMIWYVLLCLTIKHEL